MSAAMSTAVATMSVTMYTLLNKDSKRDLSQWGMGLSSIGMIFCFYGIIHLLSQSGVLPPEFLPYNETIYSFLGTSLFTMYLAYHTRLIISGKHTKYQLNEKDYVFGAVLLYNDIINIFLYMLRLMASDNRD
jgi:FtsH-binding integral membrane protein